MLASLSGTLATMGSGVPYAIAAKFAYPDRVPIALVGDGAMQMNGLNELITVAKLAADRPAVVEAITDPEVPPLPPHITFEQARHFMLAVARGDESLRSMLEQSLKAKLLPGR